MYDIIKNVIESGRYELSAMCRKIDTIWLQNQISDEQHDELLALAREKADPQMSVDLYQKVMDLEKRVHDLEVGKTPTAPTEEFPEYEVGKIYYNGAKVAFDRKRYRCTAPDGFPCSWSPADYPAYWEAVG